MKKQASLPAKGSSLGLFKRIGNRQLTARGFLQLALFAA
jgi:hypothetical protein